MDKIEANAYGNGPVPWEALQAYSTYIHETVHWWQHCGSTSGLLLSLSYFSQCHSTMAELKEVLVKFGPIKSLKRWTDNVLLDEGWVAQEKLAAANFAVNNALDVFYYTSYALRPREAIQWMIKQNHFEDIGYTYSIVYGQLVGMVSASIDPEFEFLPSMEHLDTETLRLHAEEYPGFHKGSNVILPPLGLQAIYEGQARFIQLDFLNRARSEPLSCEEWRMEGYLSGIYVQAFESFLKLSETDWPTSFFDPIIPLFLLVCDISINPTRGFPFNVDYFENLIHDVDVGIRFAEFCFTIKAKPHLKTAIKDLSRDEYNEVAAELTSPCGYDHPLTALREVSKWVEDYPSVQQLMEEYRSFEFIPKNLNVRVFLAQFIAMCLDKLQTPHFFCWPGAYMADHPSDMDVQSTWLRHLSLFSDKADKDGVYPRKWPNRSEKAVQTTFDQFYGMMPLYELTEQWILRDGPFNCDFSWMSDHYNSGHFASWANEIFNKFYGVNLSDFTILTP
ncbi:hypothetical protein [Candidatus Chlorobium masyuteum]|uniref:hypothetical protein n=1 Tax=Candidatus Chlorobium masyuteum TaxID=2716876 RepID=UPI001AA05652|nr:hypothetical protein [Candidatus Chlorobium masyuteum]